MEQIRQHHTKCESIKQSKSMLKNLFSLNQRSLFSIYDPAGVKLLTKLRLQFSHLTEHKFPHNFKDRVSPMFDCGDETETTTNIARKMSKYGPETTPYLDTFYAMLLFLANFLQKKDN